MKVKIADIVIGDRKRSVNKEVVKTLAESFNTIGQMNPVTLHSPKSARGKTKYQLAAGLHRIEAAKVCGWHEIEAEVLDLADALMAEVAEIDENLMRAELSDVERAEQLKRRKEIFDKQATAEAAGENSSGSLKDGRKAGPQHKKGFDQTTADATGMTKSSIRKQRVRAEKIDPDVLKQVRGTKMDKGVELDALANAPKRSQRAAVNKVIKGKAKSIREALGVTKAKAKATDQTKRDVPMADLWSLWDQSDDNTKRKFVAYIRKTDPAMLAVAEAEKPKAEKPKRQRKAAKPKTAKAQVKASGGHPPITKAEVTKAKDIKPEDVTGLGNLDKPFGKPAAKS